MAHARCDYPRTIPYCRDYLLYLPRSGSDSFFTNNRDNDLGMGRVGCLHGFEVGLQEVHASTWSGQVPATLPEL